MGSLHHHDHGHPPHAPGGSSEPEPKRTTRNLIIALAINAVFVVLEAVGGFITNSLALLSDAGHSLSDVGALGLALGARWLVSLPATSTRRTFGYLRAEILAAFFNVLLLWGVVVWVVWEAIERIAVPQPVLSGGIIIIAAVGVVVNLVSAWFLHGSHQHDINVRGAYVHLIADAFGSVGALAAGLFIYFGGSPVADPIASVIISVLIIWGTFGLMRESVDILMEAVPAHIDIGNVNQTLARIPGIRQVHDLHVWKIGTGMTALTGHLVVGNDTDRDRILMQAQGALWSTHQIEHITLQVETEQLHAFLTDQETTVQLQRRYPAEPGKKNGDEA